MSLSIMNSRGGSQRKIPRVGERKAIFSYREAEASLRRKSDIINKRIRPEEQTIDHRIQPTKKRSEIEIAKYPQKVTDCYINAFIKICHEAPFLRFASQMTALLHTTKQTAPIG
jgi:hypothetical protein